MIRKLVFFQIFVLLILAADSFPQKGQTIIRKAFMFLVISPAYNIFRRGIFNRYVMEHRISMNLTGGQTATMEVPGNSGQGLRWWSWDKSFVGCTGIKTLGSPRKPRRKVYVAMAVTEYYNFQDILLGGGSSLKNWFSRDLNGMYLAMSMQIFPLLRISLIPRKTAMHWHNSNICSMMMIRTQQRSGIRLEEKYSWR